LRGGKADAATQTGLLHYARNDELVKTLFNTLTISGLAMRHHGSSAPASQGEHMIAHTREMLFPELPSHFHGLEIAVTTLAMAQWQEKILSAATTPQISYAEAPEIFRREYAEKFPNAEIVAALNQKLKREWPEIRAQIQAIHRPSNDLKLLFESINCKIHPQDLGWSDTAFTQALHTARFTRNRFTFLDLKPS
jgi:glycerol-1-phosphate dehydrogenase [NAD(P)+]